jgi:hypothetical protein
VGVTLCRYYDSLISTSLLVVGRISTYNDADEVELGKLMVPPFLRKFIALFSVRSIQERLDRGSDHRIR